jgi:hypothetical protein
MMDMTLNSIKAEFLRIHALLGNLTDDQINNEPEQVYRSHFERLNRLAAVHVEEKVAQRLLSDPELRVAIRRISHLKRINSLKLEIKCAESIIADSDPWARLEQFVYYPNYVKLTCMEYGGAGLNPQDRVVFLGSGPLPLSLICLYRQYGIESTGIEQALEYVALSGKLVKALGLNGHIRIIHGNHFSLPLKEECRLVMVGADALPKEEIFAHLAKVFSPGEMISYRIYEKGLRRLLDDQSVFELPPQFSECARTRPQPPVNNTSVFAVKLK